MLRTLFSPRLVGLHLLTIGVLIAFIFLGRWQLGVFEESGRPRAAADPAPVPAATLAPLAAQLVGDVVGRRVTAEGSYDPDRQLLVADRRADVDAPGGKVSQDDGYWVLTPLRLDDGTLMPVVRGWVPRSDDPAVADVPQGRVTVPCCGLSRPVTV
ncbi:SURF1 family protein, partial [Nonomuraea wenchangensis]|uniref:SURF1 family protein n=1 Tax=Nonomuraea wenchangensis TaxID=568860 RepID=UPI00332CB266